MPDPRAFCQAVLHEYERQWSRGGGHAVRHPLRLKMDRLNGWCDRAWTGTEFEATLQAAQASDDIGLELLAEELLPLWRSVADGGRLPFSSGV